MADRYQLMRKNDLITYVEIDENGSMLRFADAINEELVPLQGRFTGRGIKDWWNDRAAPISQGRMREFLDSQGIGSTGAYLKTNLGLSLTDYYWIRPEGSELTWEKVNFFDNDFKENIFFLRTDDNEDADVPRYSPNSSLVGDIEKTWTIVNGKRCIIKGNRIQLSSESINEVIASKIHEMQGYDNYVAYELIKVKGAQYDYGCISESFVTLEEEFVPAWAVHTSEKKDNHISSFEHFLNLCVKHGIDKDELRHDLEYQIMVDFIMSGYDRHYNNFGIMRDARTLKFLRMAPIFDSGGSMFAGQRLPTRPEDLLNIKTHGIADSERSLLKNVTDKKVIDLDKLPPASYVRKMYEKDSQISKNSVDLIVTAYERKIDMCESIQHGHNPWARL